MKVNSSGILPAIKALFRPLVRLCVQHAVKIQEVEQVLRELLVEESKQILEAEGKEVSVSRISAISGLQRPVVTAILKNPSGDNVSLSLTSSLMMKVLGAWQTKKEFTTKAGSPRTLTVEGKKSEFALLVQEVSRAINPYTVLFELERSGAVVRTQKGVQLQSSILRAEPKTEQGLTFLALDAKDLFSTVMYNLSNAQDPNHHITTEFDNIPESAVPELRKILLREGHEVHQRMRKILAGYDNDLSEAKTIKGEGRFRVAFSSFSNIHPVEKEGNKC